METEWKLRCRVLGCEQETTVHPLASVAGATILPDADWVLMFRQVDDFSLAVIALCPVHKGGA